MSRKRNNSQTEKLQVNKEVDKKQNNSTFQNGLSQALGLTGFAFGQGRQISQATTIFENLRFYMTSNMRQLLSQAYAEIGLIQTIVDIPVDDAMRGGIDISSNEIDEDDLKELQQQMRRNNDMQVFAQALKWNRLFGGSGIIIATDEDTSVENTMLTPGKNKEKNLFQKELKISDIKQGDKLEFIAADLWELYYQYYGEEDDDSITQHNFVPDEYNYYNHKINKSRVIRFEGLQAPSFIRQRLRGWGLSVVESLVQGVNQYLKANDLAFEVLDEFKIDVYKLHNLASTLASAGGDAAIQKRVEIANQQKNFQNAIVLDAEDDFQNKQLSFSGLAEAMDGIRQQIASDMRIPQTKLFGQSSAGFNSGEDDIENYNGMIESSIRTKFENELFKLVQFRCQATFGMVPNDLTINFESLRLMSSEQEENVKTQQFNRALQAYERGLINETEFREISNKDELLGMRLEMENVGSGMGIEEISDGKVLEDETLSKPLELIATNAKMKGKNK